jgi:hypothetical protein
VALNIITPLNFKNSDEIIIIKKKSERKKKEIDVNERKRVSYDLS